MVRGLLALVQEDVDTMEDKKWECPECASLRNERRLVAQERARLKRAAQGKAVARQALQTSSCLKCWAHGAVCVKQACNPCMLKMCSTMKSCQQASIVCHVC